jgi:hypothetical protein
MIQKLLQQQQGTNDNSDHRDLRLAMRVLLYRARGHERRVVQANTQTEEADDDDDDGVQDDDPQRATSELEDWWIRDSGEAAFDGKSLVEHHDRLAQEVRESFRQQGRNLRWFAAHGPAVAVAESDESVARLFAVAQANALTLSDPSSLRPIGTPTANIYLRSHRLILGQFELNDDTAGQGLYASAALLNHSCLPNANWSVGSSYHTSLSLCVRGIGREMRLPDI